MITLCPHCERALDDGLHVEFGRDVCCQIRDIINVPRGPRGERRRDLMVSFASTLPPDLKDAARELFRRWMDKERERVA